MEYPEGSLLSFEMALKSGFGIEVDVQKIRDNHLVVIHDDTLKRYSGSDRKISDILLEEFKGLDYRGQKLALFEEICCLFLEKSEPDALMAIHIKDEKQYGVVEDVIKMMSRFGLEERSFIFDITLEYAKKVKEINPSIKLGISVSDCHDYDTLYTRDSVINLDFIDIIWWDEFKDFYTEEDANRIKQSGKKLYAISPELHLIHDHPKGKQGYEDTWKNLIKWEVDGICTDYPDEFEQFYDTMRKENYKGYKQ